ncbi:acyltransferase [Clostridium perfringens]|nr:acyltransferase [Clostridium perfringens]
MLRRIEKKKISNIEFLMIIISTFIKILRGGVKRIFFKEVKGVIFIGKNTCIMNRKKICLGKNVKFERNCEVQGMSTKGIHLGDNVTIGSSVMIRPSSYYGVEVGEGLKVGKNSSIGPMGYIGCAGFIEIGDNVMIGPRVSLFAENHVFKDVNVVIKDQGVNRKGIKIEDDCWIGSGVIILDGVTIGRGSVIGAGTIVNKDIPAYSKVVDLRNKAIKDRMEN